MGKGSKSKRFTKQSKDSVSKHGERFPYHMTYSEAEEQRITNHTEATQEFSSINSETNPDMTLGGF
jgi:hypothetical protein